MTAEERKKLRAALLYVADCLEAVDRMERLHSCNDCGIRRACVHVPDCGAPVRWNCPLWKKDAAGPADAQREATPWS